MSLLLLETDVWYGTWDIKSGLSEIPFCSRWCSSYSFLWLLVFILSFHLNLNFFPTWSSHFPYPENTPNCCFSHSCIWLLGCGEGVRSLREGRQDAPFLPSWNYTVVYLCCAVILFILCVFWCPTTLYGHGKLTYFYRQCASSFSVA